uniref:(northern house mosquito) hypothetical protein n=1 Tax=Culex pipiens TaxID=7175 RepID=A0A8D8N803_CULPI
MRPEVAAVIQFVTRTKPLRFHTSRFPFIVSGSRLTPPQNVGARDTQLAPGILLQGARCQYLVLLPSSTNRFLLWLLPPNSGSCSVLLRIITYVDHLLLVIEDIRPDIPIHPQLIDPQAIQSLGKLP